MTHPLLRVLVLMGGPSEEHAISLKSGQGVAQALARRGFVIESVIIPREFGVGAVCELVMRSIDAQAPDVVFIALHGACGEDWTIQQLCEERQVLYVGSSAAASRVGLDKVASRQRFKAAGLAVPPWECIDVAEAAASAAESVARCEVRTFRRFSYPFVVKPVDQGSSIGVSLVRQPADVPAALADAGRYGPRLLVEAFVPGREMTVGVLDDAALPVVEIRPTQPFFDFTAKYTAGATAYVVPAPLPPAVAHAVQAAGVTAHRSLGCRHLSRTDIILTPEQVPVVLEVNTIPGFTPTSLLPKAAAQLPLAYDELCEQLVVMAWRGAPHLAHSS